MKKISINNGGSFTTPEEALKMIDFQTIILFMEDETREKVHNQLAPCTPLDFVTHYLNLAKEDLIIG